MNKICPNCSAANPLANAFCGVCGSRLPEVAQAAPASSQKSSSSGVKVIFAILFVGLLLVLLQREMGPPPLRSSTPADGASVAQQVSSPAPVDPLPASGWDFSSDTDSMGRKRSFASIRSLNTLDFGFPYSGSQHGTLMIRKKGSTDVLLSIERGQFLCGVENCTVNVRFDEGPIQHFEAAPPADQSTTNLFIEDASSFIAQLRKAKTVNIEATFYQEGSQTLEFNVRGFSPL